MRTLQKITPNLWFNGNAEEAVNFYTSVFPNSQVLKKTYYPDSTEDGLADFQTSLAGKVLTVQFSLDGYEFVAINAGPEFKPTPATSFMVNFDPGRDENAREHLDEMCGKLLVGGEALMPLDTYDFSERYGWVQDRFGYTWQLILTDPEGEPRPFIIPSLMFGGEAQNQAKEAIRYYTSVFKNSQAGVVATYPANTGPAVFGSIMFADFQLENQWFAAMDSAVEQNFSFTEAVSFSVACKNQEEIDYLWEKLSADHQSEQCGWCKDKFGVSWQIIPENIDELMNLPDAFARMMEMKKIIITDFKK